MATLDLKFLSALRRPRPPSSKGAAAVMALGDQIYAQKGVNQNAVKAVRLSMNNKRRLAARKSKAVA